MMPVFQLTESIFFPPPELAREDGLLAVGIEGMSVLEAKGFGRSLGYLEQEERVEPCKFLPKLKLEIVVDEELVDDVIHVLRKVGEKHTIGAGKIFVVPVEDAVRVSTAEQGRRAVS